MITNVTAKSRRLIVKRLLISLFIILFIRFGSFLPLPGINQKVLNFHIQTNSTAQTFIRTFSNDSTFLINLFTLNIFPYINATILAQFLLSYYPSLSKLRKEGSLTSRRKITRGTRLFTAIWATLQSMGISFYLCQISSLNLNFLFFIKISLWLTAGSMIVLWLSDLITDYGLGNGTSLLVCTNIASNFPNLYQKLLYGDFKNLTIFARFSFISLFISMIMVVIFLQLGTIKIEFISSRQLKRRLTRFQRAKFNFFYIPLKLNQIGVMPIIFTTTILTLPNSVIGIFHFLPLKFFLQILYWGIYFIVLVKFSYFYSNITLNPKDLSNQLQKMASVIPGIRPGVQTTFYLKMRLKRLSFIAALILGSLSAFPKVIGLLFNISDLTGLSAISFLIVTGVLVEIGKEAVDISYLNFYSNTRNF